MTAESKRKKAPGKKSPLTVLQPIVVLTPADYALDIVLDAEGITRTQRDAAIEYLNEKLGGDSSSFKLRESSVGAKYVLHGSTAAYTGDEEFRALYLATIRPRFPFTGTLKMDASRVGRKLMGVECVVTAAFRSSIRTPELPQLDTKPDEAMALEYEGNAVSFTVHDPNRPDSELIGDTLAVAAAYGVYVEKPPLQVNDPDRRARLYPEFRYTAPTG